MTSLCRRLFQIQISGYKVIPVYRSVCNTNNTFCFAFTDYKCTRKPKYAFSYLSHSHVLSYIHFNMQLVPLLNSSLSPSPCLPSQTAVISALVSVLVEKWKMTTVKSDTQPDKPVWTRSESCQKRIKTMCVCVRVRSVWRKQTASAHCLPTDLWKGMLFINTHQKKNVMCCWN